MTRRVLAPIGAAFVIGFILSPPPAQAAQIRGTVIPPPVKRLAAATSYTRARVAQPSALFETEKSPTAILLQVKESLPTPPPEKIWKIRVHGMRLDPPVIACVVDESVEFVNEDGRPITVHMGEEKLGTIPAGSSKTVKCSAAGDHRVTVEEAPHMRGMVHVGSLGITVLPAENGGFSITAPKGTYDFKVVGLHGVMLSREVTVENADVDLKTIDVTDPTAAVPEKKEDDGRPRQLRVVRPSDSEP